MTSETPKIEADDVVQLIPSCDSRGGCFVFVDRVIDGSVHGKCFDGSYSGAVVVNESDCVRIGKAAFGIRAVEHSSGLSKTIFKDIRPRVEASTESVTA